MLLVVIGHVTLTGLFLDPATPIPSAIEKVIYSFHMPLFMFISGWLFYFTAIKKDLSYKAVLSNKIKRLGIPFLFFTMSTTLLKVIVAPLMKRTVDMEELLNTFILFRSNPLGEMWFIVTLFVLMSMYPLYKKLLNNKFLEVLGLVIALCMYYFYPRSINYFQLDKVAGMMIFFYSGILVCKYNLVKLMKFKPILIISFFLLILLNFEFIPSELNILKKYLGIIFSLSLCLNVANVYPSLFNSFRDYTFQIFLMGIFFQMGIRYIYSYLGMNYLYIPLYMISILLGIYIPVIISKFIKRIDISLIKRCFGL